jgi:hypothetical protein
LEKKWKKAEYARQYRLKQKLEKEQRASNATLKGDGSDSLKQKIGIRNANRHWWRISIGEEMKYMSHGTEYNRHAQHCNMYTSCV